MLDLEWVVDVLEKQGGSGDLIEDESSTGPSGATVP
jgi:hypothetical protein